MENQDMEKIIGMLAIIEARMDASLDKIEAMTKIDIIEEMDARHKEMMAWLTDLKINRQETMACQETMEACLECKEPASVEMKPEVTDEEVPLEDTARMPVGEPRKRRQDRNLAAQRRQKKEQKRTQSKNGCRKDLVAARRGTTRRATVARRRRIFFTKDTTREYRGSRKRLVQPAEGRPAVQQWHGARKISSGKVGSETTL
jgi:hypothetical protein